MPAAPQGTPSPGIAPHGLSKSGEAWPREREAMSGPSSPQQLRVVAEPSEQALSMLVPWQL